MKKLLFILHLITVIMFVLVALLLGSCTETLYEEVEKIIYKDTVKTVFVDRLRIDSVAYPVFGNDTVYVAKTIHSVDTVYLPSDTVYISTVETVYDTIINIKYLYDTIHVVQHHYHDTLYIPLGWSSTSIGEYQAIVEEFYTQAHAHGWQTPGGDMLIQPWMYDEAPPENRSSYSFWYFDQFILKIKDTLTPDEAYTAIFRELARWQLGKKYTQDGTIMDPEFDPTVLVLSDSDAKKKPYLDKLFAK